MSSQKVILALIATALAAAQVASAQDTPQTHDAADTAAAGDQVDPPAPPESTMPAEEALDGVTITGTRIQRDGYEAPVPLTVITADALKRTGGSVNAADALNTLPVFANSSTPASAVSGVSAATQGLNILNLRAMGGARTLTLFDGQRSVPSLFTGEVDVNNFPQQLLERVETVTGGGSAVYGSDAVAGVVNFILDKDYTGFKTELTGGRTKYGDDESYKVSMTGGFPFSNGRGHVLLSGEMADREGVTPGDGGRSWNYAGWGILVNPNFVPGNGQPEYLVRPEVSLSNATHGGIIISGPLRGTYFGEGGQPFQFNYGPLTLDPWTVGGDWRSTEIRHDRSGTLEPENHRENVFGRLSYDVTDNANVYLQAAWGYNNTYTATWPPFQAGNGPTILSGNPFIPAEVQAQMSALGLASFRIGSMNYDLPTVGNDVTRETNRYVLGADGTLGLFGDDWKWTTYYQHGKTESTTDVLGVVQTARYALAVDAVRAPNGSIVCRSTLTNPTNGCTPWNPLGINVNNDAALNYVTGTSSVVQTLEQDVYAAAITGEPFSAWAGPISLALSAEYREDDAGGVPSGGGPWFAGNFSAFTATNSVKEAALEFVLPLAKEAAFADALDLNAAVRYTDYKYSGEVNTWKVGAIWRPIRGLQFRGTTSHDIRAPNFNELFAVGNSGQRSAFDPFTNTIPQYFGATEGNANLDPEEGDTYEFGVVLQPTFWPGFSTSIDYWNIELDGAIASPNDNQTLLFCFQGRQEFCDEIERDAGGVVTKVTLRPFNIASLQREGLDLELGQRVDMSRLVSSWTGQGMFRLFGSYYLKSEQDDGLGGGPFSTLRNSGQFLVGPPRWRFHANFSYALDGWTGSLTGRGQSSGVIDARYIECTANCPASGQFAKTIEDNTIPSVFYFDGSVSKKFRFGGDDAEVEAFVSVKNLLDRDPPYVPQGPTDFTYVFPLSKSASGYDVLGRSFLVGLWARF
jgi:iron complex outermembrane recepter protein